MLRYAARLRLPAATTTAQIQEQVDDVLTGLGLIDRAEVRVGSLSGGERKRASIGVELLTRPRAFFLDEPTSGLDPVTGAELIRRLRGLADSGVSVMLSTHKAADAEACDQMVVLTREGRLAFSGSPAEACTHFAVDRIEEIYRELAADRVPTAGESAQPVVIAERGSVHCFSKDRKARTRNKNRSRCGNAWCSPGAPPRSCCGTG